MKYYTPTIEDLHIGLVFELKGRDGGWVPINDSQIVWEILGEYENDSNFKIEEWVRIKFLDREDIERLGWAFVKEDMKWLIFTKDSAYIHFKHEGEVPAIIISYSEGSFGSRVFYGFVKNKSQLKKVLEMVL